MINEYTARRVAAKDMQPCLICSKPTVTVLYNVSGPDWFYTCDIHLRDNPQFATPLYSGEYQGGLEQLKALKTQIDKLSAASKPASWDGWVSHLFIKKPKKEEDEEEDSQKKSGGESEEKKDADTLKELRQRYSEQIDLVTALQKKNRKYKLSDITFDSRVQKKRHDQIILERKKKEQELYTTTDPEEISKNFAFPSVPSNTIKR